MSSIAEIVERAKAEHCERFECSFDDETSTVECVDDVAVRVAKAVVEEHRKVQTDLRDLAAEAITILSTCPDAAARMEQYERLHKRLVGLAAQGPGKGNSR